MKEGGRWYREKYDYFSLPLFVRENSLIATCAAAEKPDYDYSEGLTVTYYQPKEGKKAVCRIPDTAGNIVNTITAEMKDGKVVVTAEKPLNNAVVTVCEGSERRNCKYGLV